MLVVAAVAEELGDLPGKTVGIGPVVSAASMARILALTAPSAVLMIGTAGRYAGGPPVGQACVARRVGLADGAASMGLGYVPRPPAPLPGDPRLLGRCPLIQVDVLNTGAVSTDPLLSDRLADGWQVEHLEVYGVAWACAAASVPFLAILGIANDVGPQAHAQWLTNRVAAQDAARLAARALLGNPGGLSQD